MYFGGSVVGKASTIGIEISPTHPLNFTGGQKVRNLSSLKTLLNFAPPPPRLKMQQDIGILKQKCNAAMTPYVLVKLYPPTPEKALSVTDPPPKIACENALNRR